MEIQIDTSILSQSSNQNMLKTNVSKVEESINSEIDNFVNANSSSISTSHITTESNYRGNFYIQVEYFLLENSDDRTLVAYGVILENNQKFFEYNKNEKVFVYTREGVIINKLISNFTKGIELQMKFYIDDCLFIKYPIDIGANNSDLTQKNFIFAIFISPILKIFFSFFSKFKYNKWENIFINSNYYEEAFLLSKVLSLIGYEVAINTANFKNKNYLKEDFTFLSSKNENVDPDKVDISTIVLSDKDCQISNQYNYIIDTTGDSLSENSKINTFNLLQFDGRLILLDLDSKISNYSQLDPRDLEILSSKSLQISFTNTKNCMKFNKMIGREINFIHEMMEKLDKFADTDYNQNTKILLKKLDCKVVNMKENLKELTIEEITSSNYFINLYIL